MHIGVSTLFGRGEKLKFLSTLSFLVVNVLVTELNKHSMSFLEHDDSVSKEKFRSPPIVIDMLTLTDPKQLEEAGVKVSQVKSNSWMGQTSRRFYIYGVHPDGANEGKFCIVAFRLPRLFFFGVRPDNVETNGDIKIIKGKPKELGGYVMGCYLYGTTDPNTALPADSEANGKQLMLAYEVIRKFLGSKIYKMKSKIGPKTKDWKLKDAIEWVKNPVYQKEYDVKTSTEVPVDKRKPHSVNFKLRYNMETKKCTTHFYGPNDKMVDPLKCTDFFEADLNFWLDNIWVDGAGAYGSIQMKSYDATIYPASPLGGGAVRLALPNTMSSEEAEEIKKLRAVSSNHGVPEDGEDDTSFARTVPVGTVPAGKSKKPISIDDDEEFSLSSKKKPVSDDEDDHPPKKGKKPVSDDEEEEPQPKKGANNTQKKGKKPVSDDEDEEPKPKKTEYGGVNGTQKKGKKPVSDDEEEEEPKPKKKGKKPVSDDEEEEPKPKKKGKKPVSDDEEEEPQPKKGKKPVVQKGRNIDPDDEDFEL